MSVVCARGRCGYPDRGGAAGPPRAPEATPWRAFTPSGLARSVRLSWAHRGGEVKAVFLRRHGRPLGCHRMDSPETRTPVAESARRAANDPGCPASPRAFRWSGGGPGPVSLGPERLVEATP